MEVPPDVAPLGFLVGTSGYYFNDWIGRFNPPKVTGRQLALLSEGEQADQDRLRFYQKYFPFVEVNNTFYHEPSPQYFDGVLSRSRASTQYAVKVHRDVSHTRKWDPDAAKELMLLHVGAVMPLAERGQFYSFLVQLEDRLNMDQRKLDYLLSAASVATDAGLDVHIEFRHRSWHTMHALQSLKDAGVGICNTEIPPVPHAFPLKPYATSGKGYVRYSGRNLENWYPKGKQTTSQERLAARNARYDYLYTEDEVRERTDDQIALRQKVDCVAVAYNNHYNTQAVMNAVQNMKLLNALSHLLVS